MLQVKVQRLKAKTGKRRQVYIDACLDESGWSPEALERLLELSSRLPYEEASHLSKRFGLAISSSSLEVLTRPYARSSQQAVRERLVPAPLVAERSTQPGRLMVLQIDGVYVLGRPQEGGCPGLEIQSAVLYPQNRPGERWMLADKCSAEAFLPLLAGLLEQASITSQDTLVGLGDGAKWIDNAFYHLAATRITDVFHAVEYLDVVMQALSWDEPTRHAHRRDGYRGEVNARDWLRDCLPEPDVWLNWDETATTALSYIDSRLDSMDYALFKSRGYPIGSGQIEGANMLLVLA